MQLSIDLVKNKFKKSFETYNENAIVQKIMAQVMVEELVKLHSDFDWVLELGCGSGLLTQELLSKVKFKHYIANDIVEKSEEYIKAILPQADFFCEDARNINLSNKCDLIISNAMFQWFDDLKNATLIFKKYLNKNGLLAFSTFSEKNFCEIRQLTGLSLNYKSLDEIKNLLSYAYDIVYLKEFSYKMMFPNAFKLLEHMKMTGVNSLSNAHMTFKEVKDFCQNYQKFYPEISLTYSPIIVICRNL